MFEILKILIKNRVSIDIVDGSAVKNSVHMHNFNTENIGLLLYRRFRRKFGLRIIVNLHFLRSSCLTLKLLKNQLWRYFHKYSFNGHRVHVPI